MRNIMLFVAGTTPQIITETIWALHTENGMSPDEIHVITTLQGARVAKSRLLGEGHLQRLCGEIGISMPQIEMHVVPSQGGEQLEDVRNSADNVALANWVVSVVRSLAEKEDCRIIASLSGGRKTMGFYMGYAMSLLGRPQDELYHVMVSPDFERCRDFFFKSEVPQILRAADGKALNSANASIELARIPFLRLRGFIDEPILEAETVDFGVLTDKVQTALTPTVLSFDDMEAVIRFADREVMLEAQQYILLRTFAKVRVFQRPGAGPDGLGANHVGWLSIDDFIGAAGRGAHLFLEECEQSTLISEERTEFFRATLRTTGSSKKDRERLKNLFSPKISKLRSALRKGIADPVLRNEIALHRAGSKPSRYGLMLRPHQIELG